MKEYDVHWQELSQRKELAVSATYASEKGNRSANELVDVDEEKLEELVLGHMREVIANNMTTEILKMVDNLQQIYSLHPNGHKHRGHPAISHSSK